MGFNRDQAHELLQVVEDSYARTADLKKDYELYEVLLYREEFPGQNPLNVKRL